ncbi:MAG: efflux RND transporter permease subunit, partial [Thermaerobacter sp.]|nr:efflux RND transporter permease subunit [Thermaerobacter sp.]
SGPSLEGLRLHADEIKNALAEVEGITEVTDNMGVGASEFVIRVKRTEAAELGVSPMAVASAVRTAFQGETVARVSREGREIDVTVRLTEAARQNLSALENLMVAAPQGRIVRLKDVASVEPGVGPAAIRRLNNQRVVSISASIAERDLQSVSRDVEQKLQTLSLPDDYSYEIAGEMSEMREAFDGLTLALVLAIVLVYMVMAAQFESLLYPLIVMFSLPLAIIGVLLALFFTGTTLSVPSVMGIIVLAGIVVNNAIVLVDYINQLRERGKGVEEAIVEAAGVRLRPILMTTATTVLALVPLAVMPGSGAEMQQPLGIAVIGGLTVSTILTLYIIPIAYDLVTLRRRNGHEPEEA